MGKKSNLRSAAEAAIRHVLNWREGGPKLPAFPSASADDLRARFDTGLPEEGLDPTDVIERLAEAAEGGLVNNTHPNFFAFVQGASHEAGVAADILTSGWGQNAATYQTAPAAAIAEEVAGKWLKELLRLPEEASFAFTTGATMGNFICLASARSEVLRCVGYDLETEGFQGAPLIHVFHGREAHATVQNDLRYLGFGRQNLVPVPVDQEGRMVAAELRTIMDAYDGPMIVVTQAGHINSGAFDPIGEIVRIAKRHDAWVHVDGAFGLWARAVPEIAHHCEGIDEADSWTVDGHKWLQVPYDSGFAFIRNEAAHRRTMNITASYLVADATDGRNPSHYGPELSRRSRGFAVWAVLQVLGRQGIVELISRHCACAQHLASRLSDVAGIHILNEVILNQLAISFGDDALTEEVIAVLREENQHFILGASWKGQAIMRVSVISHLTDIADMDALANSIITAWETVQES